MIELFLRFKGFLLAMGKKMIKKERAGAKGWDDPQVTSDATLTKQMRKNIDDRDWVDVANIAAILFYRKTNGLKRKRIRKKKIAVPTTAPLEV